MFGNKRQQPIPMDQLLAAVQPPVYVPRPIIAQDSEYRPCYVNGRRGLFHRWANIARPQLPKGQEPGENVRYFQYRNTHAIVEFEDGTVELVWPRDIKFAGGGHFKDYAWQPADRRED